MTLPPLLVKLSRMAGTVYRKKGLLVPEDQNQKGSYSCSVEYLLAATTSDFNRTASGAKSFNLKTKKLKQLILPLKKSK